jgi:hypothetical protein
MPIVLVRLDLAEMSSTLGGDRLPAASGTLWCCAPRGEVSASPYDQEVEVFWTEENKGRIIGGVPLQASAELQLPRVWSAPVQSLGLDASEHRGWQSLRRYLAARQGVELYDELPHMQSIHRFLGYPDERRGDMPLACELLDRNCALGDDPPAIHRRAAELEPFTRRWRLLLQLTLDQAFPWSARGPAGSVERLYLWIDDEHLDKGDFSRVQALRQ